MSKLTANTEALRKYEDYIESAKDYREERTMLALKIKRCKGLAEKLLEDNPWIKELL